MQYFDHDIGFREKRQFFRRKLLKIAENCDHNIDPSGHPDSKFAIIVAMSAVQFSHLLSSFKPPCWLLAYQKQGDRTSLLKSCPNCSPTNLFGEISALQVPWKRVAQTFAQRP
jgi:hypothetical protein